MTEHNESIFTICVPRKSEKGFYRIQTIWNENDLKIYLLDDLKAYNSTVNKDQLTIEAKNLDLKYDIYIKRLMLGLQNDYNDSYYYERKGETFLIFRQQNVSTMQIKLITFDLEEVNYMRTVENFIDTLRSISIFYKEKLEVLENEKNNLLKEKTVALQDLEKFIFLKDKTENDLYSNFILLLNEKKKQIARLTDLVATYKNGAPSKEMITEDMGIHPIKINNKKKIFSVNKIEITKKIETISDSGSDTEIEIDIFEKPTQKQSECPTKRKIDLLNDDDDDDKPIYLPKRAAQSSVDSVVTNFNTFTSNIVKENEIKNITDSESQDLEEMFATNELILQNSLVEAVCSQNSTESPNFHTQDLLDRL